MSEGVDPKLLALVGFESLKAKTDSGSKSPLFSEGNNDGRDFAQVLQDQRQRDRAPLPAAEVRPQRHPLPAAKDGKALPPSAPVGEDTRTTDGNRGAAQGTSPQQASASEAPRPGSSRGSGATGPESAAADRESGAADRESGAADRESGADGQKTGAGVGRPVEQTAEGGQSIGKASEASAGARLSATDGEAQRPANVPRDVTQIPAIETFLPDQSVQGTDVLRTAATATETGPGARPGAVGVYGATASAVAQNGRSVDDGLPSAAAEGGNTSSRAVAHGVSAAAERSALDQLAASTNADTRTPATRASSPPGTIAASAFAENDANRQLLPAGSGASAQSLEPSQTRDSGASARRASLSAGSGSVPGITGDGRTVRGDPAQSAQVPEAGGVLLSTADSSRVSGRAAPPTGVDTRGVLSDRGAADSLVRSDGTVAARPAGVPSGADRPGTPSVAPFSTASATTTAGTALGQQLSLGNLPLGAKAAPDASGRGQASTLGADAALGTGRSLGGVEAPTSRMPQESAGLRSPNSVTVPGVSASQPSALAPTASIGDTGQGTSAGTVPGQTIEESVVPGDLRRAPAPSSDRSAHSAASRGSSVATTAPEQAARSPAGGPIAAAPEDTRVTDPRLSAPRAADSRDALINEGKGTTPGVDRRAAGTGPVASARGDGRVLAEGPPSPAREAPLPPRADAALAREPGQAGTRAAADLQATAARAVSGESAEGSRRSNLPPTSTAATATGDKAGEARPQSSQAVFQNSSQGPVQAQAPTAGVERVLLGSNADPEGPEHAARSEFVADRGSITAAGDRSTGQAGAAAPPATKPVAAEGAVSTPLAKETLAASIDAGLDPAEPYKANASRTLAEGQSRSAAASNARDVDAGPALRDALPDGDLDIGREPRATQPARGSELVAINSPPSTSIATSAVAAAPPASPVLGSGTSVAQAAFDASPTYALMSRPDTPEFGDEVAARVRFLVRDGIREARLQLHPAELGRLQVVINTEGDQARVAFVAENGAARDAIEQALPRLRDMLEQQGLQLADADVGQRGFGQSDGRDEQVGNGLQPDVVSAPADTEAPDQRPDGSSSLIDTYI